MNRRTRVGLSVATVAALGLALDFAVACGKHVREKAAVRGYQCESWCPCKCNQKHCGCHEGKPFSEEHLANIRAAQQARRARERGDA